MIVRTPCRGRQSRRGKRGVPRPGLGLHRAADAPFRSLEHAPERLPRRLCRPRHAVCPVHPV